jgi:hypothetical protein
MKTELGKLVSIEPHFYVVIILLSACAYEYDKIWASTSEVYICTLCLLACIDIAKRYSNSLLIAIWIIYMSSRQYSFEIAFRPNFPEAMYDINCKNCDKFTIGIYVNDSGVC